MSGHRVYNGEGRGGWMGGGEREYGTDSKIIGKYRDSTTSTRGSEHRWQLGGDFMMVHRRAGKVHL